METNLDPNDYQRKFSECDERFEAIFRLTSAASKIIDSDLTILRVNDALADLIGYSADELTGTKILDYACEEDKQHWHELQDAMWQQGKPNFHLDACIYKKDGSLAWVHVTTIAFKENNVPYAYTILDDFTARKQLQESEEKLNTALQYSKMAVWELDLLDRSITRSEGFDRLFGLNDPKTVFNEATLLAWFLPEDREQLEGLFQSITTGEDFDFQGRIYTNDGIIKWINFQGRAEKTPAGKEKILGTLYDITREKQAEREKDDFISIASHELKTPLTSLKGSLQVLERMKDKPTPMFPTMVQQAVKSMDKVTTLVDELLNAGRVAEGQLHLKKTRFNLFRAIEECCLHVTAAGTYQLLTEGDKGLEVEGDSERIQRVVVNYVNNAVKYAPRSKEITIRVEQQATSVKVSVIDKGPGIAAEKIPHLFDRFYRVDQSGGQYSGLGLGLYISAEIIKKHGGEVGVNSQPGQGSTFWFTLPTITAERNIASSP
ncbi:MAG: PAS domain-containing sensor histidine kinase [Mucilaginibacter sp.]|nr:PAS domain-containing sensor histidine kinase [Mucilaginibacter sp.]